MEITTTAASIAGTRLSRTAPGSEGQRKLCQLKKKEHLDEAVRDTANAVSRGRRIRSGAKRLVDGVQTSGVPEIWQQNLRLVTAVGVLEHEQETLLHSSFSHWA